VQQFDGDNEFPNEQEESILDRILMGNLKKREKKK
jgi:hypothetical protein